MRLICCSDFHGRLPSIESIPEGDVFVFGGDLCPNWSRQWRNDCDLQINWIYDIVNPWLDEIPVKHKLVLFGNHDGAGTYYGIKKVIKATVLHDESTVIDGIKFYGSPWTVMPTWYARPGKGIDQWCFGKTTEEEIGLAWDLIPNDVDVLMTHSPAHMIQDMDPLSRDKDHFGSTSLTTKLKELKQLRVHICGHCHNTPHPRLEIDGIIRVNAAERVVVVDLP